MSRVGPAVWKMFSVDGETYHWTSYASEQRAGDGPWEPIEYMTVSRRSHAPGIGAVHPAGTIVTEQHAVDLIRRAKAHGRDFP
jgi:hypothetical protein